MQFLSINPEVATRLVALFVVLAFAARLWRRIRAGERGLLPTLGIVLAVLGAAGWLTIWENSTLPFSVTGFLPAIICGLIVLALTPAALRGWWKDPYERKPRALPDLALEADILLPPMPAPASVWHQRLQQPREQRVRAGRLDMRVMKAIGVTFAILVVWFWLWFTGLSFMGWPFFLPLPIGIVTIIVLWNRRYRDTFVISAKDEVEGPDIRLPEPGNLGQPLPQMPRPQFGRIKSTGAVRRPS
jgi:hypothetical protein